MESRMTDEIVSVIPVLRRTLAVRADDVETPWVEHAVTPRTQRQPASGIAACMLIAVGAGSLLAYRALAPDDRENAVGTAAPTTTLAAATADDIQWYLPTEIPADYVLTDLRASPSEQTVEMLLTPTGRGVGMHVVVRPTNPALDLGDTDDIKTIDGHDYAISQGDITVSVTSIQGDVTLQVINAYDQATALEVASGIEPVPIDGAREAAAEIDERLKSYPQVAAATLGNGTSVTVRRAEGVDDVAVALCVDGATPTCQQQPSDADPGAPAHVAATFDNGGGRRVVAWHETEGQLAFFGHVGDERAESLPGESVSAREGEG